ncbi:MAG: sensor histidine kinase [Chloroflexi bacterium]|nr:MAG: sensor histidine kinase [Chloroflexota bacterium]MBL1196213.1 sensor histidine kinase [Chloroflexota bacterium]NOH13507.1 HAMP domain-containing protein [Chloroflexota bacterium]
MRTPIQLRLSLTIFAVLLLGMALAGVLAWQSVETLFLNTQRENLLAQAQLTASTVQGAPLPPSSEELYQQTANTLPGIHTRLLGEQGAVLLGLPLTSNGFQVEVPLAENAAFVSPDDLLQRPEIQSALEGTPATAVRRVASADDRRVLYAAAAVFDAEGNVSNIVYLATPLPPASLPPEIVLQLAGAGLVAVLLAGIAGVFLTRRIARPLEGLVQAASSVAGGDLEQHVPANSGIRELHNLGEAFNEMTANLRQSDEAKNAFIADVTHELRTPLTVINGTIETLEDGALDDLEGRGPLLASMQRETSRLIRLVNDLLILTRADAGALNLELESIDLGKLVRARCDSLSALAAPRRVKINVKAEKQAKVLGDADRLTQVLDNVLDNAIRFAPDGSTVSVDVRRDGDEVLCTISDQGPGIPAQQLPLIFERFYRVDTSRNRNLGESGLGLSIVQSLISAHKGRVIAESVEGRGTTITFCLPVADNCPSTA